MSRARSVRRALARAGFAGAALAKPARGDADAARPAPARNFAGAGLAAPARARLLADSLRVGVAPIRARVARRVLRGGRS